MECRANSAVASPVLRSGPENSRPHIEVVTLREHPRIAPIHRAILQVAHIAPQLGAALAPDVRHLGFDRDGKRPLAAEAGRPRHDAIGPIRAYYGIRCPFP